MKHVKYIVVLMVLFIFSITLINSNAEDLFFDTTEKIIVKNNDTLWDIACKINDGSYNNHKIVFAIKEINDLGNVILRPGQALEVPVIE